MPRSQETVHRSTPPEWKERAAGGLEGEGLRWGVRGERGEGSAALHDLEEEDVEAEGGPEARCCGGGSPTTHTRNAGTAPPGGKTKKIADQESCYCEPTAKKSHGLNFFKDS